jgi:hypothetical protein
VDRGLQLPSAEARAQSGGEDQAGRLTHQ